MHQIFTPRKQTSFDPMIEAIFQRSLLIPDHRSAGTTYSISDAVMSGIALFSLKDPSLLAFTQRRNDQNMKNIFRIKNIPSDTSMREILDPIDPDQLRPMFQVAFRKLQRGGGLKPFQFRHDGQIFYPLLLDGTEYFNSNKVHCPSCMERKHRNSDEITYYHQMLGAVIAHPDQPQVIPLAPEPIIKQDGNNKNDCERNAAKRLLGKIRAEHPLLNFVVVEDALSSNAPHIQLLRALRMSFLLGVKPADHAYLYDEVIRAFDEDRMTCMSWPDRKRTEVTCEISFTHALSLNKSNSELLVNFLQYSEYGADGERIAHFSWVTDLPITRATAKKLVAVGRARWKVENETFNTLKNQGYQFEHNYGHGDQNLSVVLAMLMMLAFLVDQVQELHCPLFRAVHTKFGSRRLVWDNLRSHFRHFEFRSMHQLYEVMYHDLARELPAPSISYYGARVP